MRRKVPSVGDAPGLDEVRRILIYGVTGSGKSTLAAKLSEISAVPWHSVDDLAWQPGWVPVTEPEQRHRIQAVCEGPEWILDTAYSSWRDIPFGPAQLIVALDYPRWFSLQRLVRRTVARTVDRREICNGNHEPVRSLFSRDSILIWHFRSYERKHQRIRDWLDDPAAPPVLRHTSSRQTAKWLRSLAASAD